MQAACAERCWLVVASLSGCCTFAGKALGTCLSMFSVVQEGQGRPHLFCDMRIVDDQGQQQPNDGKAVGHLQVRQHVVGIVITPAIHNAQTQQHGRAYGYQNHIIKLWLTWCGVST